MRFDGILKSWNDERGFGFVEPLKGGEDIFVHIKAFRARDGRPQVGQMLSFEIEFWPQGKRAKNVESRTQAPPSKTRRKDSPTLPGTSTLLALPIFLILVTVAKVLWEVPSFFAGIYLGLSFFTFLIYARDKAAAQQNNPRTPELTLHLLAVLGGWPGALLAQQYLRHKSIKTEFQIVFWATVVVNTVVFLGLCSMIGTAV